MTIDSKVAHILREAENGRLVTKTEAKLLLSLPEDSLEAALLRSCANSISRKRFNNAGLLLGQIGVDMAPCDGDCAFCFFARSHTGIKPSVLSTEGVLDRCWRYVAGGAQGVFLMTMHRFGFEWFCDLCSQLRASLPEDFEILANVGDMSLAQLEELRAAGASGAYHVCRLREGIDSHMDPNSRHKTIERILGAGLDWYTLCEPVGPEHTPEELAEQIWLGVDLPCRQHGAMQRFPVPTSPLHHYGRISLPRLGQIVAVIVLATLGSTELKSIAVNVANLTGLFSGANAFFPEAGEPETDVTIANTQATEGGFTTALWRQSNEITTADCRGMLREAGFSHLMDIGGKPSRELQTTVSSTA